MAIEHIDLNVITLGRCYKRISVKTFLDRFIFFSLRLRFKVLLELQYNMSRGTKALELWCRRQIEGYPSVEIHNMTTSWKNGMAFCALVHHFRPDLM